MAERQTLSLCRGLLQEKERKSGLGHDMQAYRDETMIKMAFDVEVDAMAHFWRKDSVEGVIPLGVIKVEIYNKSGHAIPDG